jgi:hypothetical protein
MMKVESVALATAFYLLTTIALVVNRFGLRPVIVLHMNRLWFWLFADPFVMKDLPHVPLQFQMDNYAVSERLAWSAVRQKLGSRVMRFRSSA